MLDIETFTKLSVGLITALTAWNLKETVAHGKTLARLETKLENGLTEKLDELKREVEKHIDGEEGRILGAMRRDPWLRTRATDYPLRAAAARGEGPED